MNTSKYEYRYHTDILYSNGLKDMKPIVLIFPHHCGRMWPSYAEKFNKFLCENKIFQISLNVSDCCFDIINPVKNKNDLSCVYTFSVPRGKHSPSRLQKQSQIAAEGNNSYIF